MPTGSSPNGDLFAPPCEEEIEFVAGIFAVQHFEQFVSKDKLLRGGSVADPWVIARAAVLDDGCVVTEEKIRPNAAKIPNVCDHFGVRWTNMQGLHGRPRMAVLTRRPPT